MIDFKKYSLENGLKILLHHDPTTPIIAVNILYDVGSKDEEADKTGFAHLFEHLMFGGSINIPRFDEPLERVGGENNAFTNSDITNYYITVPLQNLETALWLESDRMLELAFSEKSLDVQRNVVIEEFKQSYLNQPYGDVWLHLRPLAYTHHPYQWCTIGKTIEHIQQAKMEDVKDFFYKYYCPDNANITIAGNIDYDETINLVKKWFGDIPKGNTHKRNLTPEPIQTQERKLTLERDVPYHAIYKAFHIGGRHTKDFYICDLLSDMLSNGKSSRLYNRLVKEKKMFSDINAYISGDMEPGLFIVSGKLSEGTSMLDAEAAINNELNDITINLVEEKELQKVKNKIESVLLLSEMNCLNKAMNLSYFELLGDANLINSEITRYNEVSAEDICNLALQIFKPENSSTLYYYSKQQKTP